MVGKLEEARRDHAITSLKPIHLPCLSLTGLNHLLYYNQHYGFVENLFAVFARNSFLGKKICKDSRLGRKMQSCILRAFLMYGGKGRKLNDIPFFHL